MNKKIKLDSNLIFTIVVALIALAYYIVLIVGKYTFEPTNMFYRSFNIFSGAGDPNKLIRIASYFVFILSASWIVRFVLGKFGLLLHKGRAIINLTCSLIKYAAVIVLVFMILKTLGVDTTAILAGIGILGLIVGLGAQPLIADIIAGLFIVFENVFEVGDIIVVDGFRGTVDDIGIRTTKIEDVGGNIKVINNADIKTLVNMTQALSVANCEMSIEYGESLERVEAILAEALPAIKEAIPEIKEGPFYKGVSALSDSSVNLKFIAKCEEGSRYQVERDLNRQFKLLFDKNNINIPFPQIVVNQPVKFENVTKKQQKAAEEFVSEQKELSKALPDGDRPAEE
ncbi:MAG: mechanosensitive ion channel family protein [Clostridia bacterium]|nr:mechanosensitive ion channel family protein [Clostridia bacterium]